MGVSALPPQPPIPTPVAAASPDEAASVRTAAQWLVVAAGAVAATLVTGLQLGDIGKLSGRPPQLVVAAVTFLAALLVVGRVIARASAVLVVRRVTVGDLLTAETQDQLREGSLIVVGGDGTGDLVPVLHQIRANREWLFEPGHHSMRDLQADLHDATARAGHGDPEAERAAARLEQRLTTVCAFARAELTRVAYRRLRETITGWPGWVFALSVAIFYVALSVPVAQAPAVGSPYNVVVVLTGTGDQLRSAGLAGTCTAPARLVGVAVDGSATEPVVVTDAGPGCPPARFTVTEQVGVAIPHLK